MVLLSGVAGDGAAGLRGRPWTMWTPGPLGPWVLEVCLKVVGLLVYSSGGKLI